MRNWIAKIREKKKEDSLRLDRVEPTESFRQAMSFIGRALSCCTDTKNKVSVLEYFMDTIRKGIQYDYLSRYIYSGEDRSLRNVVPNYYFDDQDNKLKISDDEYIDVHFDRTVVISCPWSASRTAGKVHYIKKAGFKYDKNNHQSRYFSQIDICFMTNGFHSSAVGVHLNDATIKSEHCHVERMYDYVHTDGEWWILTASNEKYYTVADFRIAVLYEVSKIKYQLEQP